MYSVEDHSGHLIESGLCPHIALRAAQDIANSRGESVWLYESPDGPTLEICPDTEGA